MVVNLVGKSAGFYYCFGCSAQSKDNGFWNGLAAKLGLQQDDGTGLYQSEHTGLYKGKEVKINTLDSLFDEWGCIEPKPVTEKTEWRGIQGKTLKMVGAYQGLDAWGANAIYLPLYVGDEVHGIKALYKPTSDGRKYFNSSGDWSKTVGLYPMHLKKTWKRVVLVEGPRDALSVIQAGLPALAILGSKTWSLKKRDLLLSLGVEQVLEALDPDESGREGAEIIKRDLKPHVNWKRRVIKEGKDPASIGRDFWLKTKEIWK
jgi:5S rRNA maturation endonuclease (ribonuclease M5)